MGRECAPSRAADDGPEHAPGLRDPAGRSPGPPSLAILDRVDRGARGHALPGLQRAAGNAALVAARDRLSRSGGAAATTVQRCGDIPAESCPCHDGDEHTASDPGGMPAVQRRDPPPPDRKPDDLTGTPFEKLDGNLKAKLADNSVSANSWQTRCRYRMAARLRRSD